MTVETPSPDPQIRERRDLPRSPSAPTRVASAWELALRDGISGLAGEYLAEGQALRRRAERTLQLVERCAVVITGCCVAALVIALVTMVWLGQS